MPPIHTSVSRAFFAAGSLNAWTPFAMASTPVIAVHPDANAFSTRKSVSSLTAATSAPAEATSIDPPVM